MFGGNKGRAKKRKDRPILTSACVFLGGHSEFPASGKRLPSSSRSAYSRSAFYLAMFSTGATLEIEDELASRKRMISDDSMSEPGRVGRPSPIVYVRNRANSTPNPSDMSERQILSRWGKV